MIGDPKEIRAVLDELTILKEDPTRRPISDLAESVLNLSGDDLDRAIEVAQILLSCGPNADPVVMFRAAQKRIDEEFSRKFPHL